MESGQFYGACLFLRLVQFCVTVYSLLFLCAAGKRLAKTFVGTVCYTNAAMKSYGRVVIGTQAEEGTVLAVTFVAHQYTGPCSGRAGLVLTIGAKCR